MKQTELLQVVIASLPYANQITGLELEGDDAVIFNWRGGKYRVSGNAHVEEVKEGTLRGSDAAILMERLFRVKSFADQPSHQLTASRGN